MREINELSEDYFQREVSTFDYRDALRNLEEIYLQRLNTHRFTLAPMGSKIRAWGPRSSVICIPTLGSSLRAPKSTTRLNIPRAAKLGGQLILEASKTLGEFWIQLAWPRLKSLPWSNWLGNDRNFRTAS